MVDHHRKDFTPHAFRLRAAPLSFQFPCSTPISSCHDCSASLVAARHLRIISLIASLLSSPLHLKSERILQPLGNTYRQREGHHCTVALETRPFLATITLRRLRIPHETVGFPHLSLNMEHTGHIGEQYDDHFVDEHDYSPHHPGYEHGHHAEHIFHDEDGYQDGYHDNYHDGEDDVYDPEAHDDAQTLDFEPNSMPDYEPPSPSYPYPEDQQPPDLDIPLLEPDARSVQIRSPKHVSEIYAHDAVSGTELDHDNSIISEYLRSKGPDWDSVARRSEPMTLLDLPVDVLRLIVKEVDRFLSCPGLWSLNPTALANVASARSLTRTTSHLWP